MIGSEKGTRINIEGIKLGGVIWLFPYLYILFQQFYNDCLDNCMMIAVLVMVAIKKNDEMIMIL